MGGTITNTVVDIRSSPALRPGQAFEQWEAFLSESYAPLAVTAPKLETFHGRVRFVDLGAVQVSSVEATPHDIYRSRRLVGASVDPVLWAVFSTTARGWLEHSDRTGEVAPDGLLLYDSARPLRSHFQGSWSLVTVQLPLSDVLERTGLSLGRLPTTVRIPTTGALGAIEQFFRGLLDMEQADPAAAALMGEHAVDLVASATLLAAGNRMTEQPAHAFARQQVVAFIRRRYTDPDLTVEQIARACALSRRSLHRLFEGGVGTVLRRCRVAHARGLLCADPSRSLASIAAACGFASERHFYRVFKRETGMAPGEFRAAHSWPPTHPVGDL